MRKTIIVFGATGGIGGAVARFFSKKGWLLLLPVRNITKPEAQKLSLLPNARIVVCNAEDKDSVLRCMQQLKDQGLYPDIVFQATGTFLWDDGFPGPIITGTPAQQQEQTAAVLRKANLDTKINVVEALEKVFDISRIGLYLVGSHAGRFAPDHAFRNGPFKQEAYCEVMGEVLDLGEKLSNQMNPYRYVYTLQTGLVDTPLTRKAFPPERAGDIDWDSVQKPDEYIETVFAGVEL